MRLPILVTLVVCLITIIGVSVITFRSQQSVALANEQAPVPTFRLRDASGAIVTNESLRGRIALVYFGYTFCPDVCPNELSWMTRVLHALGTQANQICPILISVDPERDTPAGLRSYAAMFDDRILALTGSLDEITAAAAAFNVIFRKSTPVSNQPGFYLIDHSMSTIVLDREGRIAARLQSRDLTPEQAAAHIRLLLEKP